MFVPACAHTHAQPLRPLSLFICTAAYMSEVTSRRRGKHPQKDSARHASGCTEQDRSHKKYQYLNACIIEFSECGWGVKRGGGIK